MEAKISEIFLSYQGEGPLAGNRQLFIRFYGCNMNCSYCDTVLSSYHTFSRESLLARIMGMGDDYNELVLTGGEPLVHVDFIEEFLPFFLQHSEKDIYLETNGTLPGVFSRIIDFVDHVAMDFKLPSSDGGPGYWDEHKSFMEEARAKALTVKSVITSGTVIDDIKKMCGILASFDERFTVVLQPVTPVNDMVKTPDGEMIYYFREFLRKNSGKDIMILGQMHKYMGIK